MKRWLKVSVGEGRDGVKSSWKIKLAVGVCGLLLCTQAEAGETLLASTTLRQEQGTATVELWGERLPNGYVEDLLLLLKDSEGKLTTAYTPSLKGGYNPLLQAVQVKALPAEKAAAAGAAPQQVLLSVGQGDWNAGSEFRIVDFADPQRVTELFNAADSMGLVTQASIKDASLQITLQDGQRNDAPLAQPLESDTVDFGGLFALTAYDLDGDGRQELLSSQQLTQRGRLLADVGAAWRLQAEADKPQWQRSAFTVMTATPVDKSNTINDGRHFAYGSILPRKMVVPGGEATYPVFASPDAQLQNKINAYLAKACEAYLQLFYQGQADMAFKVIRADDLLLSLQLISGKNSFVHSHVHLDPKTGAEVRLEDILNTGDADLLPLLNLLCTNKNMDFTEGLPKEWYIEGGNLFLLQNICGKEEVAGFALGNLHKFLRDKKWLQKLTGQSVFDEKESKREKNS